MSILFGHVKHVIDIELLYMLIFHLQNNTILNQNAKIIKCLLTLPLASCFISVFNQHDIYPHDDLG